MISLACQVSVCLVFGLNLLSVTTGNTTNSTILQPSIPPEIVIPAFGRQSFTVENISSSYSYVIFEAHTQRENVSISADLDFPRDLTVEGKHVGILNLLKANDDSSTMYLKSDSNISITVLVYAELHISNDTVPGACNQVFKLENDPNVHITTFKYWTLVDFQWANVGFSRGGKQQNCEVQKIQDRLRYDVYVFFMSDQMEATFLSNMPKMLGAANVQENGRKVVTITNTGSTKSLGRISAAKGQGVVYAIVVTDTSQGTMSSYIPVQTYSCLLGDEDCSKTYRALDIIIAIASGICGLFLCFLGHRYLQTEFFLFGFIGFTLVFFIIITKVSELSTEASFGVSVVMGVVGGSLFLALWYYFGLPVLSVLLVGLTAGYLLSSFLFYTPFGNLSYWDSTMTYGLTFTCGLLIGPVFLLCFTKTLNILACTFIGSYLFVIFVDILLWSNLKFIILTSIYRQTVPDYLGITVTFPYGKYEIILSVVWVLLLIAGTAIQFYRERKKAPFPPCPAHVKKARRLERPSSRPHDDEERRPLLDERSRPQYSRGQGQGQGQQQTESKHRPFVATAPPVEYNQPT